METCRLLRLPQVIELTGLGRGTIYRYIREAAFRGNGESANVLVAGAKMRLLLGSIRDPLLSLIGRFLDRREGKSNGPSPVIGWRFLRIATTWRARGTICCSPIFMRTGSAHGSRSTRPVMTP